MFALERQKIILEQLKENGAVLVSKLSVELGVTEETVRRDLEKLEAKELLLRTHGGAIPLENTKMELSLEKRKNTNTEIKEQLAAEAAKFIVPGDTIFLDASTTTFYLAKELKRLKN
ncbi:MAG: DeoR/GlpR transcriptional regulator, partial [Clostridia bacterium]|nr:DeoR/GlpR transcriptional regulator [Clostridia bacterium]